MTTTDQPRTIDPATAKRWLDSGEAVLVDVREPDEHMREHIAGASLAPLSRFDPAAVLPTSGRKLILHCKGGVRSADALARLGASCEAYSLAGGIEAWKKAGLPVEAARVPISIMRQVQIVAGSVVLLSSILAWLVSPLFLILTGFFGAGLLFAGSTGWCGMAAVLRAMPWNKAFRQGGTSPGAATCTA